MRRGDRMISIHSLDVDGLFFIGIELELPEATFFVVANEVGFIVSATFALQLYSEAKQGKEVAATIGAVQSIDEFLQAPLKEVTKRARMHGWEAGMQCKDALLKIA